MPIRSPEIFPTCGPSIARISKPEGRNFGYFCLRRQSKAECVGGGWESCWFVCFFAALCWGWWGVWVVWVSWSSSPIAQALGTLDLSPSLNGSRAHLRRFFPFKKFGGRESFLVPFVPRL